MGSKKESIRPDVVYQQQQLAMDTLTSLTLDNAFLESSANVLEYTWIGHLARPQLHAWQTEGADWLECSMPPHHVMAALSGRRPGTTQRLVEYHNAHMTYSYDMANDAQRNVTEVTVRDAINGPFYVRALLEDVLPCHQFPCTDDVDMVSHVERTTHQIHHRIAWIIDRVAEQKEGAVPFTVARLRYTHADNADMSKIRAILGETLEKCGVKV